MACALASGAAVTARTNRRTYAARGGSPASTSGGYSPTTPTVPAKGPPPKVGPASFAPTAAPPSPKTDILSTPGAGHAPAAGTCVANVHSPSTASFAATATGCVATAASKRPRLRRTGKRPSTGTASVALGRRSGPDRPSPSCTSGAALGAGGVAAAPAAAAHTVRARAARSTTRASAGAGDTSGVASAPASPRSFKSCRCTQDEI